MEIAEETPSGTSPRATDFDAAKEILQWTKFRAFMEQREKEVPFPKYLYRAQIHGYLFPRLVDYVTGDYCDTFGSDIHLWVEYDAGVPCDMPITGPIHDFTVEDIFDMLAKHLNKTQSNLERERNNQEEFLSYLVSISGDFRWTAQRICKTGKLAEKGTQTPGLAIFETSVIKSCGYIWRVKDMLDFLDQYGGVQQTVSISPKLRRWATNADEYVCWDLIPQEALVSFTPLCELTQELGGVGKPFLGQSFVNSNYLGDRSLRILETVSLEEYGRRVSSIVHGIIANVTPWTETGPFSVVKVLHPVEELDISMLKDWFLNPKGWVYALEASDNDLEEEVTSAIQAALEGVIDTRRPEHTGLTQALGMMSLKSASETG